MSVEIKEHSLKRLEYCDLNNVDEIENKIILTKKNKINGIVNKEKMKNL